MATDLGDLRTELRSRFLARNQTALSDARLDFCVRAGVRKVASPKIHRHAELETNFTFNTVASTDEYVQPALWAIHAIRCTTPGNIRRLVPMGIQTMLEIEKTQGAPLVYARHGRIIHLDPIPNGVFTLRVFAYNYPSFPASPMSGACPLLDLYDESVLTAAEATGWSKIFKDVAHGKELDAMWQNEMAEYYSPDEGDRDDMQDSLGIDFDYMRKR